MFASAENREPRADASGAEAAGRSAARSRPDIRAEKRDVLRGALAVLGSPERTRTIASGRSGRQSESMTSTGQGRALYATEWSQVSIDDVPGPPPEDIRPGAEWTWRGELWRIDAAPGPLRLEGALGRAGLRRVAARRAARMAGCAEALSVMPASPAEMQLSEARPLRAGFVVTDGRRAWAVSHMPGREGPALALFEQTVPARESALWIVSAQAGPDPAPCRALAGLAAGTRVETPFGPVPVERLRPGDAVLTDRGAQPLRAVRLRPVAAAITLPAWLLGSAGAFGGVTVGYDTWVGVEAPALEALFGLREALVRAGDLEALPGARPAPRADVIALTLDGAPLVMAGGLPCLAGGPGRAELRCLRRGEAQIALGHAALRPASRLVARHAA